MVRKYNSGGIPVVEEVPGLGEGFGNFVQQLLQGQQRKKEQADFQDIMTWAKGGFQGDIPKMKTQQGRQFGSQAMMQHQLQAQNIAGQKDIAGMRTSAGDKGESFADLIDQHGKLVSNHKKLTDAGQEKAAKKLEKSIRAISDKIEAHRIKQDPGAAQASAVALFDEVIADAPKEKIGMDKRYSKKAYQQALGRFTRRAKIVFGFDAAQAKGVFNSIWGERYMAEADQRFQKYDNPDNFGETAPAAPPAAFTPDANDPIRQAYKRKGRK